MFRAAMQVARGDDAGGSSGGAAVNVPSPYDDDLVPCKICGRTFNENAAQRHIPLCEKKQKEQALKKGGPARRR
jgi:hypothetical protein